MPPRRSSFNKPFDRILKAFVDEAARLLLEILGIAERGEEITITPIRAETAPPVLYPDFVVRLGLPGGEEVIFHIEFQLDYDQGLPARMAHYGVNLAWHHGLRVVSVLVLLRSDRTPDQVPEVGEDRIGETRISHRYRVVRLWETSPELMLATNNPALLPWAILMKSSEAEVRFLAEVVARQGDEEAIGRFLTLGSLRYDRDELIDMLGGSRMGIVEVIMEGSSLIKYAKEKAAKEGWAEGQAEGKAQGVAEGKAQGMAEGQAQGITEGQKQGKLEGQLEGARRMLRGSLLVKFPGLETMPEIDLICDIAVLESLLVEEVLKSDDRTRVRQAIETAGR